YNLFFSSFQTPSFSILQLIYKNQHLSVLVCSLNYNDYDFYFQLIHLRPKLEVSSSYLLSNKAYSTSLDPSTIEIPLEAPIRVAPTTIIALASSEVRTPPEAFTPISGPTVARIS